MSEWRTMQVGIILSAADYRRAHDACHRTAQLWNTVVDWVHTEWAAGRYPSIYDTKKWMTTIPRADRPFHAHTAQAVVFDLFDAITTARTNRRNGMIVKYPWRTKNYRPLAFTAHNGWHVNGKGRLSLSLGRGRPPIVLVLPELVDSETGFPIPPALWGEIKLCWDITGRRWSLHISVPTKPPRVLNPTRTMAGDEGIINPFTLAVQQDDGTINVTVINGRAARAIKHRRNTTHSALDKKMSRCTKGSRRWRKLNAAKKKSAATTNRGLRNIDHQVSRKVAAFAHTHDTGRIVVGDVRGIEQHTRRRRNTGRHQRRRLSQWSRGRQETYIHHKTGVELEHLDESYSTRTCPACLTRNRPTGRRYHCQNEACRFTCHRDAVGAINILMKALHGQYTAIDPGTEIRVTYLRATPNWTTPQGRVHSRTTAAARSKAQNRATTSSQPLAA